MRMNMIQPVVLVYLMYSTEYCMYGKLIDSSRHVGDPIVKAIMSCDTFLRALLLDASRLLVQLKYVNFKPHLYPGISVGVGYD